MSDNNKDKVVLNISDFFQKDFVDYGSYDNTRKIASYIDGFKNAGRKAIFTILNKSTNNEVKVGVFVSDITKETIYLHGPTSLEGVVVNLARDFVGSNNINLLMPEGSFGTRLVQKASAARYISTKRSKISDQIFIKDDTAVLDKQTFEGEPIEPMFMVPIIPLILVNGSKGISSGFAQNIIARKPKDLKRYILAKLKESKNKVNINPYYEGFTGDIVRGKTPNSWEIIGRVSQVKKKVIIEEVPIGYDLKSYKKVLDKLEEKNIIKSYKDLSDSINDTFKFECILPSVKEIDESDLIDIFKLKTKVTENFTCMNEVNQIVEFENENELFDSYIDIRLEYYEKRRLHLIGKITKDINEMMSKYEFIKRIINEDIVINKKTKKNIEEQIVNYPKIIKVDGSFDYLLNMKLHTLTIDRIKIISEQIKSKIAELKILKNTDSKDMWIEELTALKL